MTIKSCLCARPICLSCDYELAQVGAMTKSGTVHEVVFVRSPIFREVRYELS